MSKQNKIIKVQNIDITILNINDMDYISLTDIVRSEEGDDYIRNWMRNRNTVEFLGLWEQLNNPNFKGVEFDTFRKQTGLNNFNLTPRKWMEATDAIGIISKSGRFGGTFAHRDIAFEFTTWLNPSFKLYLIKEYQRLKEVESNQYNLEWNVKRILSKVNYTIQTDAVKDYVIPHSTFSEAKKSLEYAEEADVLNLSLFQCTAKQWREANPQLALQVLNIRDVASINELVVLSNLESFNADMMRNGIARNIRFQKLYEISKYQLEILNKQDFLKSIKKSSQDIYLEDDAQNQLPE